MSDYLGDFRAGSTVRFLWDTNDAAGASITRATNGTISVYKNGGTTQTTTGVTDTEDFDGLTGVHLCEIATTDGFYGAGDYAVVLSGATIDGEAVNAVLAHFSIESRSALMPTTAGRTADVTAGGCVGIDWANVEAPTTTLGLSGTTIKTATDVETDTADIQSRLPAALVSGRMDSSLGAIASGVDFSATMKASINTEADAALADVGVTTTVTGRIDAAITSRLADASYTAPLSAAGTRTALGLASANLDTQLSAIAGYIDTEIGTVLTGLTDMKGATFNSATDSLEAIRDRGDAAWVTGGGGSQVEIAGMVSRSGGTYRWNAHVLVAGAMASSLVTAVSVVGVFGNNSNASLGYTEAGGAPAIDSGRISGAFTLTTAPADGKPFALELLVTYNGTQYRGRILAAAVRS